MAIGKKTGGRDFKPGQSGNPKGRTPMPEDLKQIKTLKPSFVKAVIAKISAMTIIELQEHIEDPDTTLMDLAISKIYMHAVTKGDQLRLNFLLDRSIGKVKDEIDMNLKPVVTFATTMTKEGQMVQKLIRDEVTESHGRDSKTDGISPDDKPT